MLLPSIPFLALLAGAASVTVTAAAGLHNRQTMAQDAAAPAEQASCQTFNQSLADAAARVRSGAEAERLLGLRQKCGHGAVK